ncbi:MAG: glycoside hydrolase family 9 protein [Candidatus Acidiferrum sp.]
MKPSLRGFLAFTVFLVLSAGASSQQASPTLQLNDKEYFEMPGLNVMSFQDIYPEGHQAGVSIILNGVRIATNGDIRLDVTPGQWQPMPKQDNRVVDKVHGEIITTLSYPDPERNRIGFNPIDYPDLNFTYRVRVRAEGPSIRVIVDLDKPLPAAFVGKVGFNMELFPGVLFGHSWYLGGQSGIFPRQPNGPEQVATDGDVEPVPFASGPKLSLVPELNSQRMAIESHTGDLQLLDGRNKHNNGWFVVRSLVPAGATAGAIDWLISPHALPAWTYTPVVHVSQVGYHPAQKKVAVIEVDESDSSVKTATLRRILEEGGTEEFVSAKPAVWGKFLRYNYLQFDFSRITQPGLYEVTYGNSTSEPFQISSTVFQRGIWQPVIEHFLPIQMCHMRVEEQYRVWHGACHLDDARMAPINHNHFDGYIQGPSTLTKYKSGETVPGLNVGGWHDAGDDDFRIESQADEVTILASAYELFHLDYDDTSIDEAHHLVKIHVPDGKPDALQQIQHGALTILASYKNLGRFYRGVISSSLHQYTMIGDISNATDNLFFDNALKSGEKTGTHSAVEDDRWVFTEQNPGHEYKGIAALAAAGRTLKTLDPPFAKECVEAAEQAWKEDHAIGHGFNDKIAAAVELFLTTGGQEYMAVLLDNQKEILAHFDQVGWSVARAADRIPDAEFVKQLHAAAAQFSQSVRDKQAATPFGVPYKPHIWGAGWQIERFGVEQYYLHRGFPKEVSPEYLLNALNFMLGVHPGENTASFASGVGARSATVAYGFNRADWTYIPGGVVSGTALIRPDFPELKEFPYLWQQVEYVLGGGSSNYLFLVLAADEVLNHK